MNALFADMTLADWLVVSVTVHYVVIGWLYYVQNGQPLFLGLYGAYALANVFLILISRALAKHHV